MPLPFGQGMMLGFRRPETRKLRGDSIRDITGGDDSTKGDQENNI